MSKKETNEVAKVWKTYLDNVTDWQKLVKGIAPKQTGCGPVYELSNPIVRPNESFAIADMRNLKFAEPHFHKGNETEIYIVLAGKGVTVVGGEEIELSRGVVVVTPPNTAHFTIPVDNLVLAVINTPPFDFTNNVTLLETNIIVRYDADQLHKLLVT
jgi:mannose-6-phosphate isomerase-like protein (cupin superfamily)